MPCDFGLFFKTSLRLGETLGLLLLLSPALAPSLGHLVFMSTEWLLEKAGSCPPGGVRCPGQPVVCVPCLSSDRRGSTPELGLWATHY